MTEKISPQKATFTTGTFLSKLQSSILKERCKRTRILYAGPGKKDNTLVLFRLAEFFSGRYYLEETVYDLEQKSIKSSLTSTNLQKFHKVIDAAEYANDLTYKSPEITALVTYTRNFDNNRNFRHSLYVDDRKFKSFITPITNSFLRRKLFSYMNKN